MSGSDVSDTGRSRIPRRDVHQLLDAVASEYYQLVAEHNALLSAAGHGHGLESLVPTERATTEDVDVALNATPFDCVGSPRIPWSSEPLPQSASPPPTKALTLKEVGKRVPTKIPLSVLPEMKSFASTSSAASSAIATVTVKNIALELWPTWVQASPSPTSQIAPHIKQLKQDSAEHLKGSVTKSEMASQRSEVVRGGDTKRSKGFLQKLVLSPNATLRTWWDFFSVCILGYDILMVPLLFFNIPESPGKKGMDVLTTCFWTCDIVVSLFTGFHVAGVVEMRPSKIALKYAHGWMLPDFIVVGLDWCLYFLSTYNFMGIIRMVKILRASRIFRLLRLLRVMKLPASLDSISDMLQSEALLTAFGISRGLLIIALVNHFIACAWYGTGTFCSEMLGLPSWTEVFDLDELDAVNSSRSHYMYRYVTSLHWSLTQFTPASMEVFPRNEYERMFSICVLFSALVTFSSFISSITNAMTNLRRVNEEKSKQAMNIRRYITENRISIDLGNRITAFIRSNKFMAKRRVHEQDIQVFKVLPEVLRLQLHMEVFEPVLVEHALFHHIQAYEEPTMVDLCHEAMSELSLTTSQELFKPTETSEYMFFSLSGVWEYYSGWNDSQPKMIERRSAGPFFCEIAVWMKWEHQGRLVAMTMCEIVAMNTQKFRRLVSRYDNLWRACQSYAVLYQSRLREHCNSLSDVDIWYQHDDIQETTHKAFENYEIHPDSHQRFKNSIHDGNFMGRLWRTWTPTRWHKVSLEGRFMSRSNTY